MGSLPKEPWNYSPWFGSQTGYKDALLSYDRLRGASGGDYFGYGSFVTLAREWLRELEGIVEEGDYQAGAASERSAAEQSDMARGRQWPKYGIFGLSEYLLESYRDSRPVRLGQAGQRLWLHLGGSRSERGYRNIER
jgi:hypothetical protein